MRERQITRVQWEEQRPNRGLFFLIADKIGNTWDIWERESFEVRWFPVASTPERLTKAEQLARSATCT